GVFTRFDLGPFGLRDEMEVAAKFGAKLIVCGGGGPKGLTGNELKTTVRAFTEKLRPHLEQAKKAGVAIGMENHGNSLIDSPDSIRWLVEFTKNQPLSIALAPYHLPQDPKLLAGLIRELGDRLGLFYAWEHGHGCMTKLPKEEEL